MTQDIAKTIQDLYMPTPLPPASVRYVFRERVTICGEEMLLIPWRDSHKYEYPFDFQFSSVEAALAFKNVHAPWESDWILCRETTEPVQIAPATEGEDGI
jgi:hypothetical protein